MTLPIRAMTPADLAAVMSIQVECYPAAMVEDAATLDHRPARANPSAY